MLLAEIRKLRRTAGAIALSAFVIACGKVAPEPGPGKKDEWPAEATIVGKVTSDEDGRKPLEGVVVSDGYIVTKTDANGRFSLKSAKAHGYVFISTPSGYSPALDGVQPRFYAKVGAFRRDTANFVLKAEDQSHLTVYMLGDMHLADKRRDLSQFEDFAADLKAQSLAAPGPRFALTLGDMSWDAYWRDFDLWNYLNLITRKFPGLPFYHTIGNHDHDLEADGDWATAAPFKRILGPTYYSFNAGGVHFVVLDDIVCRNAGGERSSWNEVDDAQMKWLAADLAEVPATTPVIVAAHAPLYRSSGDGFYLYNGLNLLNVFKGHDELYFFTGHYHTSHTADYVKPGYIPVFEKNCAAVCGNWWYMQYDYPSAKVNLCSDGTPGGYEIVSIDGGKVSWTYKPTGRGPGFQFRTYDRNCIELDPAVYAPGASASNRAGFEAMAGEFRSKSSDNYVYINVWGYDPKWRISVNENGRALKVTRLTDRKDPLYVAFFEGYSFAKGYVTDYGSGLSSYYPPSTTSHIFRVQASSPSSTLEIDVTDRFSRTFHETMTRPKALRLE